MLKETKLYKGEEIIRFDDAKHRFWNKEGEPLVSVTGATGIIDKSGALMGWAIKMMGLHLEKNWRPDKIYTKDERDELIALAKKEYRWIKKEAADIGTEIHEWASNWILGKEPAMPKNKKVLNGVKAFLKFQKENKVKWLESERVVYSRKHKYAGFLDAVGRFGKDLVLVDFKSSKAFYDDMRFQVAGYDIAFTEESGKAFDRQLIARFGKEDGEFEIKELNLTDKDKEVFLACLAIKKRLKELKNKK